MQINTGINRDHQKENNISLLIRRIHADPQCSRTKLAKDTGLGQATITKLINQLISWGVVREREILETSIGRKPIRLEIRGDNYLLLSARIARNYLLAGLFTFNGKAVYVKRAQIENYGAETAMEKLIELIKAVMARADREVLGVGVAVPGPFNAKTGRITLMSGVPGWEKIDIRERLEEASGLPVFLEHDANCGALAELWYGKHERSSSLLLVLSDRGVGAGIIINGEVYHGALGYSGEIGHSSINYMGPVCECGNRGCIELYASTVAMRQAYLAERLRTDQSHSADITTDDFLRLSRENDPIARRIFENGVAQLAFGLVGFVNALNPNAVIFADLITTGGETFLPIVKGVLKKYLMPQVYEKLVIDTCHLDEDPMLVGAGVAAFEQLIRRPTAVFGRHDAANETRRTLG